MSMASSGFTHLGMAGGIIPGIVGDIDRNPQLGASVRDKRQALLVGAWQQQPMKKCAFVNELARLDHQDGSASFAGPLLHASTGGSFYSWLICISYILVLAAYLVISDRQPEV
jgi:hypothetical protein